MNELHIVENKVSGVQHLAVAPDFIMKMGPGGITG
jgi:hypothetical protein